MKEEEYHQEPEEELVAAASLSKGQRQALEVVEAAREKQSSKPSFARQLFMGSFEPTMIAPFPRQSVEDKALGDALADKTGKFLKEHLDPDEVDASRSISDKVVQGLKDLGLFKMKIPREYGGLGLSQANYNRVIMLVASYCSSTAVLLSAHQSIGVPQPLKLSGTPQQKEKFYGLMAEGAISAFALTEPDVGSDPAQMITEAKLSEDGTHYILNGCKLWCSNGGIADLIMVAARTPSKHVGGKEKKQISAFIVDAHSPGVEVVQRCDFMGLKGNQNALLSFVDVKVPKENLLWSEGRGLALALRTLNTGRLTLVAACTGVAKQCLAVARQWGKERIQWGKPVGLHEMGREKVAFIAATTLAMEAVMWLTSHWADQEDADIRIEAAMAKLFCSEAAWQVIDKTLQLRGGRGYETAQSLKERGETAYPVERMMRDIRANRIIEGTSEVMHLFIAREALDPHLSKVMALLGKNKVQAAGRMLGFYSLWYPARWLKSLVVRPYQRMMGPLASHYRFIERASHKLARILFHKMVTNGIALEKRQLTLERLVNIGMELFAMAATCSYAKSLYNERQGEHSSIILADHFCLLARERINQNLKALALKPEKQANPLAKNVLEGQATWLEDGVIKL